MKQTVAFSPKARNVFFHITTQCNLSCRHCYIRPDEHGRGFVSLENIQAWLSALYSPSKKGNVVFLGGEPTLHKDLPQAVRLARQIGYSSITIDTNGYLFNDFLDKVFPEEVDFISFSLDGPNKEANDPIRGEGSFDACVSGIKKAVEKGFATSVIYTVSGENLAFLEQMPALLSDLGVSRFFIQVIGLRGSAGLNPADNKQVGQGLWLKTVPKVAEKAARLGMTVTWPKVYLDKGQAFECAGIVAENYFVFPNGRVYRCPLCEDYPLHSLAFVENRLAPVKGITEKQLFDLSIPEGCVMNRLIQPGNIDYAPDGRPRAQIACCLLKEEMTPMEKGPSPIEESPLYQDALAIFKAGLLAVDPEKAVERVVSIKDDSLIVGGYSFLLSDFDRVLIVGAGKAACPMTRALERILGSRIATGAVTTKYGHARPLEFVEVTEAGHPMPDTKGLSGVRNITGLLESAKARDLVFCVLSGGGSALLPLPAEGITLHEKQKTTSALLACGAAIQEINAIRKHISQVKGGGLAKIAHPATLVTLILSDVIGDDPGVIASGPTVADDSTFAQCLEIIAKYSIRDLIPKSVLSRLVNGARGEIAETPKPGDKVFEKTVSLLVASNRMAVNAAKDEAARLGYTPIVLSTSIEGETRDVARVHAAIAREIRLSGNPVATPACVISGGETTVTLKGSGKGGRNTEFALAAAMDIQGLENLVILSCGTDGTDGPTDAAGAAADGSTMKRAGSRGVDAVRSLANNDSYNFFKQAGGLVKTGPTLTNVMDLRIMLVK
jgi:hydroxypyruvate reductase